MKEVAALCVGFGIFVVGGIVLWQDGIDLESFASVAGIALISGLGVANYDVLSSFKAGGVEFKTVRGKIEAVKDKALQEIGDSVAGHKNLLDNLIWKGNILAEKLGEHEATIEERIQEANRQEQKLHDTEVRLMALAGSRSSFDELKSLSMNRDGIYQDAIDAVKRKFEGGAVYFASLIEAEREGKSIPISEVPLPDIIGLWPGEGPIARKRILDSISSKGDASAVQFVLEVLETEEDLEVCAAAVHCLRVLTGKTSGLLDFEYWLSGDYAK